MENSNTNKGTEFENKCEISPCKNDIVKMPNNLFIFLGINPYSFHCNPKLSLMRKTTHNTETMMTDFRMEWVKSAFSKSVSWDVCIGRKILQKYIISLFSVKKCFFAWQTMVEIAEREFNISIKKKYNTKPSKK